MSALPAALGGLMAAVSALGAYHGVSMWRAAQASGAGPAVTEAAPVERVTRAIHVPVIAQGRINGYVVAQFAYVVAPAALAALPAAPDSILADEAFQALYAQSVQDIERIEKTDLRALTRTLMERVNVRLKQPAIADVMVREFSYLAKDDLKGR